MKKVTYLLLVLVASWATMAQGQNLLDNPGFETGDTTNWEARGSSISAVTDPAPVSGSYCGAATNRTGGWTGIQQNILDEVVPGETYPTSVWIRHNSTGTEDVGITFQQNHPSGTTYVWGPHGTAAPNEWVLLEGSWTAPPDDADYPTAIYFYCEGPPSGVDLFIDDAIVGEAEDIITGGPVPVYPVDVENLSDYTPTLQWFAPETFDPAHYYIYLDPNEDNVTVASAGVEPDPGSPLHINVSQLGTEPNEYTIPGGKALAHGVRFYWKVEGYDAAEPNYYSGTVATFTTLPDDPVILTEPTDQLAFPGDTATFTIEGISLSPCTYTWYRSADTVIDASDTQVLTGIDEDTLNVTLSADLATAVAAPPYYYCILDNGSGNPTESAVVQLQVKRQIAHYKFDGNTDDSAALQPHDGTWYNPLFEQYTTGVIGSGAAVFTGEPNDYIIVGTSAAPSADPNIRGDLEGSASYWVKSTSNSFMSVMGSFNMGQTTGFQLNLSEAEYGQIVIFMRGGAGEGIDVSYTVPEPSAQLLDGQWHHIAATWSSITDEGVLYLDGEIISTQDETGNPVFTPWEFPMTIGARNVRGEVGAFLIAELDDLQFYNYALPKTDVYDLYLAGPEDWICDVPTPEWITRYDVDENCVLDLRDFAGLATVWLNCNRYPASECN